MVLSLVCIWSVCVTVGYIPLLLVPFCFSRRILHLDDVACWKRTVPVTKKALQVAVSREPIQDCYETDLLGFYKLVVRAMNLCFEDVYRDIRYRVSYHTARHVSPEDAHLKNCYTDVSLMEHNELYEFRAN